MGATHERHDYEQADKPEFIFHQRPLLWNKPSFPSKRRDNGIQYDIFGRVFARSLMPATFHRNQLAESL
jgi:hypothetical protein